MEQKGAILELPAGSEKDYILKDVSEYNGIDLSKLLNIRGRVFTYNQLEFKETFGNCLCTLYAGITMFSVNNRQIVLKRDREKLCKERVKINFDKEVGGYLVDGIKTVIKEMNNGIYYRINKSKIKELLDKGYTVNIGMYVGKDFNLVSKDGEITEEEIKEIKDKRNGHSVCLKGNKLLNSYDLVIENNILTIENIEEFINSWFVFEYAYLIVPNYIIKDIFNNVINEVGYHKASEIYFSFKDKLYKREKDIFQDCLQNIILGKTL